MVALDDPPSPTATDATGNSHTGSFTGDAAYAGGLVEPPIAGNVDTIAVSGAGTVVVPSSSDLQMTTDYTLSASVRRTASPRPSRR